MGQIKTASLKGVHVEPVGPFNVWFLFTDLDSFHTELLIASKSQEP